MLMYTSNPESLNPDKLTDNNRAGILYQVTIYILPCFLILFEETVLSKTNHLKNTVWYK